MLNDSVSQLTGCTLYKESVANECYAIQIKRKDLASSSLDVQGNYWLYDKICHPHRFLKNFAFIISWWDSTVSISLNSAVFGGKTKPHCTKKTHSSIYIAV